MRGAKKLYTYEYLYVLKRVHHIYRVRENNTKLNAYTVSVFCSYFRNSFTVGSADDCLRGRESSGWTSYPLAKMEIRVKIEFSTRNHNIGTCKIIHSRFDASFYFTPSVPILYKFTFSSFFLQMLVALGKKRLSVLQGEEKPQKIRVEGLRWGKIGERWKSERRRNSH